MVQRKDGRGRPSLHYGSEGRAGAPVSPRCGDWGRRSGIVQAGSDAVHGGSDGVIESGIERRIGSACAFAAQQIDLNQAERIDIGVAQTNGSEEDRIRFEQFLLAGDSKNETAGALEFLAQHFEDAVAEGRAGY